MVRVIGLIARQEESVDLMIVRNCHSTNVNLVHVVTRKCGYLLFEVAGKFHAKIHLGRTVLDIWVNLGRC